MAFSPDGTLLATGDIEGTVQLWDPGTCRPVGEPLTGPSGWVTTVAFSPDGRLLATTGGGTAYLWTETA